MMMRGRRTKMKTMQETVGRCGECRVMWM